jgi:plasmid stabilization system protein ParE
MRLTYHPEAEAELIEAAQFYEARSPGLGARFLRDFDMAVAEIQESPALWPLVDNDLRCRTLRRFPFSIYYRVFPDALRILVVKHHSRHPDYWRNRLSD